MGGARHRRSDPGGVAGCRRLEADAAERVLFAVAAQCALKPLHADGDWPGRRQVLVEALSDLSLDGAYRGMGSLLEHAGDLSLAGDAVEP